MSVLKDRIEKSIFNSKPCEIIRRNGTLLRKKKV